MLVDTLPNGVSAVSMDATGVRAGKSFNTLHQMYQIQMWQENTSFVVLFSYEWG